MEKTIEEQDEIIEEKPPFFSRVKKLLSRNSPKKEGAEEYHYKRRFLDGKIERYLD